MQAPTSHVSRSKISAARHRVIPTPCKVDGYTCYDALAEPKRVGGTPLTLAYCWAHSRRKLHDIYQKDGSEIAAEGLRRVAQIDLPLVFHPAATGAGC